MNPTELEQAKWKQVHALAVSIYQTQQRAIAFHRAGDQAGALGQARTVTNLRNLMANKVREIQVMTQQELTVLDRGILALDEWVSGFMNALPQAIAAVPNAFMDAIRLMAVKAGSTLIPLAVIAIGLVLVVMFAEKTHTARRLLVV